jgi:hypothetical protein
MHQPPRQRRGRTIAQGNAEVVDDRFEPEGTRSRSAGHRGAERLCENTPWTPGWAQRNRRTATFS